MIAEICMGAVILALASDDWRLRRRLTKKKQPVNVLACGIVLPEPDDERWTSVQRRREYLQNNSPMYGPEEGMLMLGDILVALKDRTIFIADSSTATQGDLKAKAYGEAVIVAYYSKRALVSITDGSHE